MNPKEIAKETLRQLAESKKAPTPENYSEIYYSILGKSPARSEDCDCDWAELISDLLIQIEFNHQSVSRKEKIEAISKLLSVKMERNSLISNIQNLMGSWLKHESGEIVVDENSDLVHAFNGDLSEEYRDLSLVLLNELNKFVHSKDESYEETRNFAEKIKNAKNGDEVKAIRGQAEKAYTDIFAKLHEQLNLNNEMNKVLIAMVSDMDKLVLEDKWLSGQIKEIHNLITDNPDSRKVKEVGELFKDVVKKQEGLKREMIHSQNKLQEMVSQFMSNLSEFSEDTGVYREFVQGSAEKISKAKEISQINETLEGLLSETKVIQEKSKSRHKELEVMKVDVESAQNEIKRLREELEKSTELVRIDALTGVLNRKGLNESLAKTEQIIKRTNSPLCIALLDIDNFKKLNDTMGHHVGDKALIHLASIVKKTIRPQDTLARYGGEEFVVILDTPDIDLGVNAMLRVQRELTRNLFEAEGQKILLTFSCGVARINLNEDPNESLVRADQAMYLAKKTGKNKVLAAVQ